MPDSRLHMCDAIEVRSRSFLDDCSTASLPTFAAVVLVRRCCAAEYRPAVNVGFGCVIARLSMVRRVPRTASSHTRHFGSTEHSRDFLQSLQVQRSTHAPFPSQHDGYRPKTRSVRSIVDLDSRSLGSAVTSDLAA